MSGLVETAGSVEPMPFVCMHGDPRCDDDPCPWGIARVLCNAPADHPARALNLNETRHAE